MKKKILLIISALMVLAIVFSSSACGRAVEKITEKAIEKAVESAAGGNADVSVDDTGVAISNEESAVQVGENATVPEGWPDVVPVSNDIKIQLSSSIKSEGKTTWFISSIFSGSGEDLYNYYKSQLSSWNVDSDVNSNSEGTKSWTVILSNDKYTFVAMITDDGKEDKSITISL